MKTLKELRENKQLTQATLAKQLNISPSTVAMYERGERNPDPEMLKKIANYFSVSIDYLLGNTLHNNTAKLYGNDTSVFNDQKNNYDKLAKSNLPQLNKHDKRDISKILDELVNDLDGKGAVAFYNGDEELDDETRKLIAQSLKLSAVIAKQRAKAKFTPKKYKKQ